MLSNTEDMGEAGGVGNGRVSVLSTAEPGAGLALVMTTWRGLKARGPSLLCESFDPGCHPKSALCVIPQPPLTVLLK